MQVAMKESLDTTTGAAKLTPTNVTDESVEPLKESSDPPVAAKMTVPKEKECPISMLSKDTPTGNAQDEDLKEVVKEIMYWQQPMLSGKVLLFVGLVYYLTSCGCGYTVTNILCGMVILRLVAVAGPRFAASKMQESTKAFVKSSAKLFTMSADYLEEFFSFPTAEQVSYCIQSVSTTVERKTCAAATAIRAADKDPTRLKPVLLHLAGLMIITSVFSLWTLMFATIVIAMTVPAFYSSQHERIDPLLAIAKQKLEPIVAKAKAKGGEVADKIKVKAGEVATVAVDKYKERFAKETKTE